MKYGNQYDVAVVGAGPAGLAIAGACSRQGLSVVCVAPDLAQRWPRNYGAWLDELDGTAASACVEQRYDAPLITWPGERRALGATYVKLSTRALQHALSGAAHAALVPCTVAGVSHHARHSRVALCDGRALDARLVVDASGARTRLSSRRRGPSPAYQTAFGMLLEVARHPYRDGEMSLMDFTPVGRDGSDSHAPTFLYALPLSRTRLFVEETSLCAYQPPSLDALERRLQSRLRQMGIAPERVLDIERCVIPMGLPLPRRDQRIVAFGAAAAMVHPATGYQLMRALHGAEPLAAAIAGHLDRGPRAAARAAHRAAWPHATAASWRLYRLGMDVAARLDGDETRALMRAFFGLPTTTWRRYMAGTLSPFGVLSAMSRMYLCADGDTRRRLRGAALRWSSAKQPPAQLGPTSARST